MYVLINEMKFVHDECKTLEINYYLFYPVFYFLEYTII